MSVSGKIQVNVALTEILAGALANKVLPHSKDITYVVDTGNGDAQADRVYSRVGTLVSTTLTLDLYGSLLDADGAVINAAECCGIFVFNLTATANKPLRIGNGAAPAYVKLFGSSVATLAVQSGGCLAWYAPFDGDGLTVTNTTAQDLMFDSVANTVSYAIILLFRT